MNFSVKNVFSKFEHIRIKPRIYSHLLNNLTENLIFGVVYIIGFTTKLRNFSSNLTASLSFTLHQSTIDAD